MPKVTRPGEKPCKAGHPEGVRTDLSVGAPMSVLDNYVSGNENRLTDEGPSLKCRGSVRTREVLGDPGQDPVWRL